MTGANQPIPDVIVLTGGVELWEIKPGSRWDGRLVLTVEREVSSTACTATLHLAP